MSELPAAIRRYAERCAPARLAPAAVRLEQEGAMRLRPGGRELAFRATEELAVETVGFSWRARFAPAPLVRLEVVDGFADGAGSLVGRLWGRVPAFRAPPGPALDEGEALRYLAELPWAPHALRRNRALEWREVDGDTVEVATEVGPARAAARLRFDASGDVVAASALRPRPAGRSAVRTPWRGAFSAYELLGGVRVPTRAEVAWELAEGPFVYFRCRVTGVELLGAG